MDIKHYLRVILKGWWLVLPAILISVSTALVVTYAQTPIYRTTATFVVSPSASFGTLSEVLRGLDSLSKREGVMSTYVEIATSRTILNAVYKKLGLTGDQLKYLSVSSALVPSTNLLQIVVESDDPQTAKACADLAGQTTIEYGKSLYEIYDMKPLDPAFTPRTPTKPNKSQNLMLAALLGSAVGIGSAFLLHALRSPRETIAGITITDGDTGVYNRTYLLQRLGEELSRAKRHQHALSMALVNVEHLDVIPDMRLPRLRNEILRQVGLFMKRYLREEDLVARFEGDTFALLFPDMPGSDAEQLLEKLQTRIEWSIFELGEGGVKLNLSATSGMVTYNFNGTGRDEFLGMAEQTLRKARDNGYSRVYRFDGGEQVEARQHEPGADA